MGAFIRGLFAATHGDLAMGYFDDIKGAFDLEYDILAAGRALTEASREFGVLRTASVYEDGHGERWCERSHKLSLAEIRKAAAAAIAALAAYDAANALKIGDNERCDAIVADAEAILTAHYATNAAELPAIARAV